MVCNYFEGGEIYFLPDRAPEVGPISFRTSKTNGLRHLQSPWNDVAADEVILGNPTH